MLRSLARVALARPVGVRHGSSHAPAWFVEGMRLSEYHAAKDAAAAEFAADPAAQAAAKKEQAAFNADAVAVMSEEKANLEKLSKELSNLKGTFEQMPHDITKVVSSPGKEAVVVETHPPVSGIRAARAYYATPWDSNGMDGGSKESLLKRYAADIAAIDAKISALKP